MLYRLGASKEKALKVLTELSLEGYQDLINATKDLSPDARYAIFYAKQEEGWEDRTKLFDEHDEKGTSQAPPTIATSAIS